MLIGDQPSLIAGQIIAFDYGFVDHAQKIDGRSVPFEATPLQAQSMTARNKFTTIGGGSKVRFWPLGLARPFKKSEASH